MDARTQLPTGRHDPGSAVGRRHRSRRRATSFRYSEEARVSLLRRLVIAQEEERRRLARDLHDHLGQQLTSLRLKIEAIRHATTALPTVQSMLTQADALLSHIDRDIDFLSWELRPAALDDLGLMAVLDNYVRNGRGIRMFQRDSMPKASPRTASPRRSRPRSTGSRRKR